MKNPPLITIGITCFNAADTIARAIASAIAQDWPNTEIIIVDDCSTDDSVAVIKKITKKDKRITLHRHKVNGGLPVALNTIIDNAKGEYIAFFDDDDEAYPFRLTKQYERLAEFESRHPDKPVICYAKTCPVIDGHKYPARSGQSLGHAPLEPHGSMIADFYFMRKRVAGYTYGSTGTCTTMASSAVFRQFEYDPEMRRTEDWDLAIRIGLAGGYCIAVNEMLLDFHIDRTRRKARGSAFYSYLTLLDKHKEYLNRNNAYWGARLFMHSRFHRFQNQNIRAAMFQAMACAVCPPILFSTLAWVKGKISS